MSGTTKKTLPPLPDPQVLYDHWIYEGLSLRKIGRIYGRSRTTILYAIRSKFGDDACTPSKQSLARVVAQEYGRAYQNTIDRSHGIKGRFLTRKKEANLTTFQAIEYLDNFAYEPLEEKEEGFKLPMFTYFVNHLVNILRQYG